MYFCRCYHDEMNWLGYKGKCYGTKECEPCNCGGDKTQCDFYESVKEEALINLGESKCSSVEDLINILSFYPKNMKIKVLLGNKIKPLSKITIGLNMDDNEKYLWLVGKD